MEKNEQNSECLLYASIFPTKWRWAVVQRFKRANA